MSDQDICNEISVSNVQSRVEHVCRELPSRLAGSENGRRVAEYNAEGLRDAGVAAHVEVFKALVSFPKACDLLVTSPSPATVPAFTLGHSTATSPEGVRGQVVYVGSGAEAEYKQHDVRGKIILCELSYSPARMEKQRIAAGCGAIAAIMMNWGHADCDSLPFGSVKPAWGNPTPQVFRDEMPRIPCIGISRKSGLALKELAAQGTLSVVLRTDVENVWRDVHMTTGLIAAEESDDFVLVGGHQDSWFGEASTDNAAGTACMVELARLFSKHRSKLRRGIQFGFWPAHETGTMAGSAWFADTNWDRLREHAVAYLLIDQPACVGTSRWLTSSNLEMREFHQGIEKRYLSVPRDWKPQKKGGDASFFGLGIPMIYGMGAFTHEELLATADANMGWWHHSLDCTLDKVDFEWMLAHLKVYAGWLWELCTAPVLPFDFRAVARQFAERLEQLDDLPGLHPLNFAPLVKRARLFEQWASKLNAEVDRLRRDGEGQGEQSRRMVSRLNACQKRLSSILIPIQSTVKGVYGHDPYGYSPQLSQIPCLFEAGRLAQLDPESEEWRMLHVEVLRQRNRVSDALAEAVATVRTAIDPAFDRA